MTCATLSDSTLTCWGANGSGQLGQGDLVERWSPPPSPVNLGTGRTVVQGGFGSGRLYTCAALDDGSVKCWGTTLGDGNHFQLGYGARSKVLAVPTSPITMADGRYPIDVQVNDSDTCLVLNTNELMCWGTNAAGLLGYGDTTTRTRPHTNVVNFGANTVTQLAVSADYSCAVLSDAALKCWGTGGGFLGYGDSTTRLAPGADLNFGGSTVLAVGVSARSYQGHTCAILADGTMSCWGTNSDGELGIGTTTSNTSPSAALNFGGQTVTNLANTDGNTCAVLGNHDSKCWGYNGDGEVGIGSTVTPQKSPGTSIAFASGVYAKSTTACYYGTTCAITNNDDLVCWGYNYLFGLPSLDGTYPNALSPGSAVDFGGDKVKSFACGTSTACAVLQSGKLQCWGNAPYIGTTADGGRKDAPDYQSLPLGNGRTAQKVAVALLGNRTCVLLDDQSLKCWGPNDYDTLGYDGLPQDPLTAPLTDPLRL